MNHLRKFYEAVVANRAAGGRPHYVYCSAAFISALFDEIIACVAITFPEQSLSAVQLLHGCEVRVDDALDDDTIVVLGESVDTVS